jgi:Cu/Ag efflux pump CusA
MKKIVLTLVALMSMTMTFAENEGAANLNTTEAYNMAVNMDKLTQALSLSKDQVESVAEVHKTFSAEMMFAAQYGKDERSKMVEKAIGKDLAYMDYILNKDQYRKYVMLLNLTLNNRGLK